MSLPGGSASEEGSGDPPLFAAPSLQGWTPHPTGTATGSGSDTPRSSGFGLTALASYYRTDIYANAEKKPKIIGYIRRGRRLPAKAAVAGPGCKGGQWHPAWGGGYFCTKHGARVGTDPAKLTLHYRLPDEKQPLPYRYAELKKQGSPRLYRLPTPQELEAIAKIEAAKGKGKHPEVVERAMEGVFFLALADNDKTHEVEGQTFVRTVYGRYVRQADIAPMPPSSMHGEVLAGERSLPLAFVYGGQQPVYRLENSKLQQGGQAAKHARFSFLGTAEHGGKTYVKGPSGALIPRSGVRIVRAKKRPNGIAKGAKWVHVDLAEQALVAYDGERPVFATVVSSGKEGYEPPCGVFRVGSKHVTATMNGADPIEGWYEVEEVPWTMYYHGGYAIHGAYWHDDFGKPRSHGCTNLAPADARWVFHWATPDLPEGWQGIEQRGTWVNFTSCSPASGGSKPEPG